MTIYPHSKYEALIEATVKQIKELSTLKGGEYAGDVDRLANFRRNGDALEVPMELVWAVYTAKHWDAIQQYVKDIHQGKDRPRLESIAGRADDLIVYLILFKAMLDERQGKPAKTEKITPWYHAGKLVIATTTFQELREGHTYEVEEVIVSNSPTKGGAILLRVSNISKPYKLVYFRAPA